MFGKPQWLTPRRASYAVVAGTLLFAGSRAAYTGLFPYGIAAVLFPYGISAHDIAATVGAHYGDRNPLIVDVHRDHTEATYEPMYTIRMTGRFHAGAVVLHCIYISAMADRMDVWAAEGYQAAALCHLSSFSDEAIELDTDVFNH
jgi:hypothetical protein